MNTPAPPASRRDHRRTVGLELEEVADAFGALAGGEPEPLIALLSPHATWVEFVGTRRSCTLQGAEALARLLRARVTERRRLELTGIAKGEGTLEIGYSEPWWLDPHGIGAHLAYYVLGDARQTATVGDGVESIESRTTYFAPRAFEVVEPAQSDLISLLRR